MNDELKKLGYDSVDGNFEKGFIAAKKITSNGVVYLCIGLDIDAVSKTYFRDSSDGIMPGHQEVLHFDELALIHEIHEAYKDYVEEHKDV